MEHRGKEEKEGEGSAYPQLHPLMLHVSVRSACPGKRRMNTNISELNHSEA